MNLNALAWVMLGWQAECGLRRPTDPGLAHMFYSFAPGNSEIVIPPTPEECVELGRTLLRDHLRSLGREKMPIPIVDVSGEINPPDPAHVHTINPDLRDDSCPGCIALVAKWRDDQLTKERARRDRRMEHLARSALRLAQLKNATQDAGEATGTVRYPVDAETVLLAATLVADALDGIGKQLDAIAREMSEHR